MSKTNQRALNKILNAEQATGLQAPKYFKEVNGIGWCDHTLNFHMGCEYISPACLHCYAHAGDKAKGKGHLWGKGAERKKTADSTRKVAINRDGWAKRLGIRIQCFANSYSDLFDESVPDHWRDEAFRLMFQTTNTDWLLCTKRIEKAAKYLRKVPSDMLLDRFYIGTTVEDQTRADKRLPILNEIEAKFRFISVEPMLTQVDLQLDKHGNVDWIIGGEESGWIKRPTLEEWKRDLRDQCLIHGRAFYWKQNTEKNRRGQWAFGNKLIDGREHCDFPDHIAAYGPQLKLVA